ncbi:hypothetical protein J437_LFUL001759 [Ladona fulva]|uniref:long-chain-fatty-acid--CoA ligase n=1 Tax=Ladona fulva TaxID=123851 RepID=A0A8K0JVY2_LADFU|nr:hypothetical protein J437_LFUL001759 [Ladona fulva]
MFRFVYRYIKVLIHGHKWKGKDASVVSLFDETVKKDPSAPCFYFEDKKWTYQEVELLSKQVACVFAERGYKKGDVVAVLMGNCPQMVCVWLGLSRLGVISALVNPGLRNHPLAHSIAAAKGVRAIVFHSSLSFAMGQITDAVKDLELLSFSAGDAIKPGSDTSVKSDCEVLSNVTSLDDAIEKVSLDVPINYKPSYSDPLLYIYTSGTTGLPKAAVVPNSRPNSSSFTNLLKVSQYIGEMCRYLLATPPGPKDTAHCVQKMIGNGLRPAIWNKFVERFKVPQMREIYASTEGNANTVNLDNTVGAVGFLPRFFPSSIYPVDLVRVDPETLEPIRNEKGFCIRCAPGLITSFRDILVMDDLGYLYFKDRKGDTFRWKGENVSTTEVESVISKIAGLVDVIVYGVEVPGTEGRAGMAAIVKQQSSLDVVGLAKKLVDHLPAYARPLFLRVVPHIDLTGTFKLKKNDLQQEGFDPTVVKDELFFCNKVGEGYKPLTPQLYQEIITGAMRL